MRGEKEQNWTSFTWKSFIAIHGTDGKIHPLEPAGCISFLVWHCMADSRVIVFLLANGNTTKIIKQQFSTRAEIPGSFLGSRGNIPQISKECGQQQDRRGSSPCSEEQIPRCCEIRRENLLAACACDCLKPPTPWIWTGAPKGERLRGCSCSQHGFVSNPALRAAAFAVPPLIIDGNLKISLSLHSSCAQCTLFSLLPSKSS